ncbi:unnamed protein product [Blepharisma stoltei]|uniref:Uncharacterized protein n=1 Tax=Blepharisma stoltei TaxID=1481888 RepID=A0AAU9JQW6_9CILI|nr:unnamed protein product [Blepharisma stoltei]
MIFKYEFIRKLLPIKMSTFLSDMRNTGGKKTIVDSLSNHYKHLNTIKPVVNSFDPPPKHVNAKSRPASKQSNLSEVKETFRRVSSVKNSKSSFSAPETFHLSSKLSQNRAKKKNSQITDHENNIKSMQRRINRIGSASERKKNPYDPIAHPALLLRDRDETNIYMVTDEFMQKMNQPPSISSAYNEIANNNKPVISDRQRELLEVPYIRLAEPEKALALKKEMLEIIVRKRILSQQDLEKFCSLVRERNSHIKSSEIDEAINFVINQVAS